MHEKGVLPAGEALLLLLLAPFLLSIMPAVTI